MLQPQSSTKMTASTKREAQDRAEATLHDQTNLLPKSEVIFVYCIVACGLLVAAMDQNAIGVLLPDMARELNAESTISWTGTSSLIANTIFQVLYGRMSDLFGRKNVLLFALILLALSDLACGLAVNATMLYIFRALAGIAGGGIISLSVMIVSDIVTLRERGKYQGILGSMIGTGNTIGPLIASGFALHYSWRGLYYFLAPLITVVSIVSWRYLPTNMPKLNLRQTIAKIDFLGLFLASAAVVFLLIPISDGGHDGTPWNSPMVIAFLVVGGLCFIGFLLVEKYYATLPTMPLSIFRSISVSAMLAQSFLLGACYYSYIYFLPLYFQNVRGKSPLIAACLQIPLVVMQSSISACAGQYISRMNRYVEVIWVGFSMWTLGAGLLVLADHTLPLGLVCFFCGIIGFGVGCCFQPTMVALQAHCSKAQRAVIVSNRNFLRSMGGAVGLAASSGILANVLKKSLPADLRYLAESTFAAPNMSMFTEEEKAAVVGAYTQASRAVFIFCVPLVGVCLLLTVFIKDHGLVRKEDAPSTPAAESETPSRTDEKEERGEVEDHHRAEETKGPKTETCEPALSRKPSMTSDNSRS